MLEAEKAFVESIEETAVTIEDMIKTVTNTLLDTVPAEIEQATPKELTVETRFSWLDKPFPRITYAEAQDILQKNKHHLQNGFVPSKDLNSEQELFLVQHLQSPVFVIGWPKELKPFYARQNKDNPELVMIWSIDSSRLVSN